MMLLMRPLCAQPWKKRAHDAADVAPPVVGFEQGGAVMLQILLILAQLCKKRDHDAADVAPPVGGLKRWAAKMLLMRLLYAQLCKKRAYDAAEVAPPVGGFEKGGGNDAADAPALCASSVKSESMMLLMLLHGFGA